MSTPARFDSTIKLPVGEHIRLDLGTEREIYDEGPYSPEAIADSFCQLKENVYALNERLQDLLDACRQLGRSYDLIVAAQALRGELDGFLRLFYNNAKELSPSLEDPGQVVKRSRRDKVDEASFSDRLESVAAAFKNLRDRLNEFREYTDESVRIKSLMETFSKDLKYRARCLREWAGKSSSTHIQSYIQDVANELSDDLDEIVIYFTFFNKYGIPSIRYEQKRDSEYDLNMSTMATFFSAVTATTLQTALSYKSVAPIYSIVSTFWFCSLVLSIGAALNSLLKRSTYGTHGRRLLPWVTIWIHGSAPMFLTLSIAFFSAGLVLFTYASDQRRYTSLLTLAFTALCTFDLAGVSAWIVYEQWISPILRPRSKPTKSEQDQARLLAEVTEAYPYGKHPHNDSSSDVSDTSTLTDVLPVFTRAHTMIGSGIRSGIRTLSTTLDNVRPNQTHDPEQAVPSNPLSTTAAVVHAAARILKRRETIRTAPAIVPPGPNPMSRTSDRAAPPSTVVLPNQPQCVVVHLLGEVHDLEYSNQGLVLAVASFDHNTRNPTTVLYDEKETNVRFTSHHRHRQGRMVKQLAWSPSDKMLLVRLEDAIDLLDPTNNLEQEWTIRRPHLIRSAAWCTSSSILFVEGGFVVKLSLDGQVTFKHHFENFLPRDVVAVPNTDLLLLVGRIIFKDTQLSQNSRPESQLILFDTRQSKVCESHPELDDMRHITLAGDMSSEYGFDVLVGHKNNRSPQLWRLQPNENGSHELQPARVRLQLLDGVRGPGYFTGDQQQMISCVGDDDHIHVWDRQSGARLHRIPAEVRVPDGSRRAVAWSASQANVVKFVTVGEKVLRIWSADQTNPVAVASSSGKSPPGLANPKSDGVENDTGKSTRSVDVGDQEQTTSIDSLYDQEETLSTNGDSEKSDQGIH